jgi:hypothetical protein
MSLMQREKSAVMRPSLQDVTPAARHRADVRQAGAFGVLGVRGSPLAPVIAVISRPDPLRPGLIRAVILVASALVPLPASPPFTLASSLTAIQLPARLRARSERLLAGRATPMLHADASAQSAKREA